MTKPRWTAPEYEILDCVYPFEGARDMHALLPHRSMYAIRMMACSRGIVFVGRCPWSTEETSTVLDNYPTKAAKRTTAMLVDRSP